MTTRRPRGVLLDIDGTLIDSNDAHARSWVDALAEHGHTVAFERVRPLIGMGGDKLLPELTGLDAEGPEGERISTRRRELFLTRHLPRLTPCRGARALVERLRGDGVQLIAASSAQQDELGPLLEQAGVADLIEAATSSDDAERSKPDPDIVAAALRRGRLAAQDVVMIGDTPYDIAAARRAGVRLIALRCGGWDDDGLAGAAAIYDDPADLLAHYEQSPLGR